MTKITIEHENGQIIEYELAPYLADAIELLVARCANSLTTISSKKEK